MSYIKRSISELIEFLKKSKSHELKETCHDEKVKKAMAIFADRIKSGWLSKDGLKEITFNFNFKNEDREKIMSEIKKFIRDGKVAVIYHEGLGVGWYTYYKKIELLFNPELVEMILSKRFDDIAFWVYKNVIKDFSSHESEELKIRWVPQGQKFKIVGFDGDEEIITIDDLDMEA